MLTYLNQDMIDIIISFLETNKDLLFLRYTSNFFYKVTNKYGFLKKIHIGMNQDLGNLFYLSSNKVKYLDSIYFNCLVDPLNFFPNIWKKNMVFEHCSFNHVIVPQKNNKTTNLCIKDFHRNKNKNRLKIDWLKLKNLKHLYVYSWDLDINGLSACKNLKTIYIDIICKKRKLIEYILTFPNIDKFKIIFN